MNPLMVDKALIEYIGTFERLNELFQLNLYTQPQTVRCDDKTDHQGSNFCWQLKYFDKFLLQETRVGRFC